MNLDHKHTKRLRISHHRATHNLLNIQRHTLRRHELRRPCCNGHLDETADERQVEDVGQFGRERDDGDVDGGDAHEGEGEVADVGWFGDELEAEADGAADAFDLDPDGDGDVEPVEGAEEELEQ